MSEKSQWVRAARVIAAIVPIAAVMDYYIDVTPPQTVAVYVALVWCYFIWPEDEV